MAKKAKLDILEIAPEEPGGNPQQNEAIAEPAEEKGSSGEQTGDDFSAKILLWLRRPLFWILLMSVIFLGLAAGILVGFYQGLDREVPATQNKQALPGVPSPEVKKNALFVGMVIDQRDERGNIRIVFCDVALELENHPLADAVTGDRVDVRAVLYDVLKKEPAREGLSPEGRGRLKEKLKKELNSLFNEILVKEVYFTRYEMD